MVLFLIGCPDLEIIKFLCALCVLVYPVAPADGTGAVQKIVAPVDGTGAVQKQK